MGRKFTYEYIKEFIEEFNYELISKEYTGTKDKLIVKCDNHLYDATFDSFKNGHRCPACVNNQKLNYQDVKDYVETCGFTLLSTEYINARKPLKMQCNNGHIINMQYYNLKIGNRCKYCSKKVKYTYNQVKDIIKSEDGYELISKEYINKKK